MTGRASSGVAAVVAGLAIVVAFALLVYVALTIATIPSGRIALDPCVTEDSTDDCWWDGVNRGNGQGSTFFVVDGIVYTATSTIGDR